MKIQNSLILDCDAGIYSCLQITETNYQAFVSFQQCNFQLTHFIETQLYVNNISY